MVSKSTIAAVQEMTQSDAESVLECVGSESAMATAISIARLGGAVCRCAARQRLEFQSEPFIYEKHHDYLPFNVALPSYWITMAT